MSTEHQQYSTSNQEDVIRDYAANRSYTIVRTYADEVLLCVVNLSRFVQPSQLDLSAYNGWQPIELIGETAFPPIGELPYFLTFGPHSFYWFRLERPSPVAV